MNNFKINMEARMWKKNRVFYPSWNFVTVIILMKTERKRNKAGLKETVNSYKQKSEGRKSLGRRYFMCTW